MNNHLVNELFEEDILLQSDKEDKVSSERESKVPKHKRSKSKKQSLHNIGDIAKGFEKLIVKTGDTPTRVATESPLVACHPSTISGIENIEFIYNSHLVVSDLPPSTLLDSAYNSLSTTPKSSTHSSLITDPINTPSSNKRQRDPSSVDTTPIPKKAKKMMELPPPEEGQDNIYVRQLVLLVPDSEDFSLFGKGLVEKVHASVLKAIKEETNPEVKFEFTGPERGRVKFVCPNPIAKEWALNIVPKLTGLWNDAKIKSVDGGDCPKMIKASIIFNNRPPNTVDLLEGIDNKNPTVDTLHWREYKRQKVQNGKTVLFIGIDEGSIRALRDLGFRPYFEAGPIKLNVPNNNNGA